ncbi:MAG: mechanosensitive ion channel family protein [Planctomycetota bacterium]
MRNVLLILLFAGLPMSTAAAQEATTPPTVAPATVTPSPALRSPNATLHTFLRAMRDQETELATSCLDLGKLTSEAKATSGPNVAYQLHALIKQLTELTLADEWIWNDIPDDIERLDPYSLDQIAGADDEARELVLKRSDIDGNWRFSRETCERVESLYNSLEQEPARAPSKATDEQQIVEPIPIRLRNLFPVFLRNRTLILPDYQWLCLLALIFIGLAADSLTRWLLSAIGTRWFDQYVEDEELDARGRIWRPIGRLANAATWYAGTKLIGLPPATLNILLAVLKLFTIFAAAWTAFSIIDVTAKYFARKASGTETKFDDLIIPMISKSLKILAVCIALLTTAQTFDVPILGLMGGLGIGGAALAFASKDAVANFFGSVTVLFDRPFEVGDWIVTDGAEGTVEMVGFRSTRIRTFYNSLITLPNSQLTISAVDNMGRRRYRRIKTTLGVQYNTTPDQLEAFCEGIRELIRRHPNTRKDYFHVYFNDFGASSLDIMLYCFVQCPDWGAELQSRHRLFADIMRLAEQLGVQFAFPTRTLYMSEVGADIPPPELQAPKDTATQIAEEISLRPKAD